MMQHTILQISQEIDQQKQALTQQVEGAFAQHLQPSAPQLTVVQKRSIPPISYILGGIAAFCCVSSLISMTGEKASITKGVLSLGCAAASAWGAFKTAKPAQGSSSPAPSSQQTVTKSQLIADINALMKKLDTAWENFMMEKQTAVRASIDALPQDDKAKQSLLSKIYTYEIIDISLLELIETINAASDADLSGVSKTCRNNILTAIEQTTERQKQKYTSLVG